MSTDCSVDLILIQLAAQLYYFELKNIYHVYMANFLFGFRQMDLIFKI